MSALSQTINNVLGGVSQQPDPVKIPGQVREAENVYLDPTFGCRKRPGTQFISKLGDDIPSDAKWIPIFRDDQDRYVACIYNSDSGTVIKVWAADSGEERTVNMQGSAAEYLSATNVASLKALTINDYTLLVNSEQTVTMNSDVTTEQNQEALIIVNQVAYNTQYNVDFLGDGEDLEQEKVFTASRLSVSPASFEVQDEGACDLQDTESFVVDGNGEQQGLGFTLTTQCSPTLVTSEIEGEKYPTAVADTGNTSPGFWGRNAWMQSQVGSANNYTRGSYAYITRTANTSAGSLTIRIEAQVVAISGTDFNRYQISSIQIASYTTNEGTEWAEGISFRLDQTLGSDMAVSNGGTLPAGTVIQFEAAITSVQRGPATPDYSYKSKYKTNVQLNNGGRDWSIGDVVTVSMAGKSYTVKVEQVRFGFAFNAEASVSYTTAADLETGALSVADIVANLTSEINEIEHYEASPIGNVIVVKRDDDRAFNLQVRGGAADKALYGLKDAVNDVSLLPRQCSEGFTLKVANSAQTDADDYFVKFVTEGGIPGQGSWEETISPGIPTNLNNGSMPHVLIREDDGTFTCRPLSEEYSDKNFWVSREVGDDKSNPVPTFVDKTIREAFFFMNRLGFLSEDTVVMSQAGDYFNFFQGSAIAISDADPIDMAASSTKPARLKAAIGTPAGLLLFAENSQFLMETEDVAFGPATVKMTEITNYSYNSDVEPVETGVSVLFATSAETYSKVFELSTDSLQARALVSENTRIIPEYIPPNLYTLSSVPNSSMVLMGTGDETLYVFKFYNTGNERNLAGWTKWIMPTKIRMINFAHDTGYFVGENPAGEIILTRLEIIDDPETSPIKAFDQSFTPRLDHYIYEYQTTLSEPEPGRTRITVPDGFNVDGLTPFLVATFQGTETFYTSGEMQQADDDSYYFDVDDGVLNSEFIVGLGYTMKVVLPSFYVKAGEDNRADRRNPPMVENLYIDLYYSGRYQAIVSKIGYQDRTIDLEPAQADIYIANSANIEDFSTRDIPIYSRGDLAKVSIIAPDPLPASFTSYSWEGHYSTRGIKTR